jgi:hypothetical protein
MARSRAVDACGMNVQLQAAMQIQSMVLGDTRDQIARIQATPVPANAPASAHADVIFTLSAAAQALTAGG